MVGLDVDLLHRVWLLGGNRMDGKWRDSEELRAEWIRGFELYLYLQLSIRVHQSLAPFGKQN